MDLNLYWQQPNFYELKIFFTTTEILTIDTNATVELRKATVNLQGLKIWELLVSAKLPHEILFAWSFIVLEILYPFDEWTERWAFAVLLGHNNDIYGQKKTCWSSLCLSNLSKQ